MLGHVYQTTDEAWKSDCPRALRKKDKLKTYVQKYLWSLRTMGGNLYDVYSFDNILAV
jgi:hypothetical protein